MKLIKGEFKEKLDLLFASSIRAGFPSPAEDYQSDSLDFNRDLIKHPEATFYGQVEGDIEGEFNVKLLDLTHKKDGYIELKSANPKSPNFRIDNPDSFRVWGVVIWTIKGWK